MYGQFGGPSSLWHPGMTRMMRSIAPIFASVSVGTFNLIIDRILASGLKAGHLSDMNYASKIGLLPSSLIGVSIATALYTRFVTHTLDEDETELRRITSEGCGLPPGLAFSLGADLAAWMAPEHGFAMSSLMGLLRGLFGLSMGTAMLLRYVLVWRRNMISRFVWGLFRRVAGSLVRVNR